MSKPIKKGLSLRVSVACVILLIVVLTSTFMSYFSFITSRDMTVQSFGEKAKRIAQTVASAIDPDRFNHIVETMEKDDYWHTVQALLNRAINKTDVQFIYTLFPKNEDGYVTYFAAGLAEGRELPVYFLQLDYAGFFHPVMFQTIDEGIATMSGLYDSGEFGILIGGFAPIIDGEDRVVGMVAVEIGVNDVIDSINAFVYTMAVFAVILSCAFSLMAMFVANKVFIRPIKTITETLTNAAGSGESRCEFPSSPINEIDLLLSSFGKLVHLEVVEESNRSKSKFLARMSHEIRTPITAVLGIAEIELRSKDPISDPKDSFAKIHSSASTLLGIVNDILDLSKIEAGKMEILSEQYETASMIYDIVHTHLVNIVDGEVEFRVLVSEHLPGVLEGDVLRIKQVMNNLLSNAFKYTKSGEVCLSFAWHNNELNALINDTGMGMSQEQLEDLHSDYTRFHERELRHRDGAGLGMSIVYNIVNMMGGTITLESEVGKGTSVSVSIPQKTLGDEVLGIELAQSLERFESGAWATAKVIDFVPESMPYGKVLVVDDVDTNLYVIEAMLEMYNLNIELCDSGKAAIDKIQKGNVYDIIFMDHMMPEMDGIEATKTIRKMGYSHPIVAFSANTLKGHEELFMSNGFSGFMSKPIEIKRLNAFLLRFVKTPDNQA